MLRKLISETIHNRLLEYASKNNEVTKASEQLFHVIYRLYEYLSETHEDVMFGDIEPENIRYPSRVRYNIEWGDLPKPKTNMITIGDMDFFGKSFDLNVVVFFIDKKNWALNPKYKATLERSVPLGQVIIHGDVFTRHAIDFFFTSSMIEDSSFKSVVEHELMHAFQVDKEKTTKQGWIYHHRITRSLYTDLENKLKSHKDEYGVRVLLRLCYLLEPTEKSAWMQGIVSNLQQSYENYAKAIKVGFMDVNEISALKSDYYDNLKRTFNQFEEIVGSGDVGRMVNNLAMYLEPYVPFYQHAARKMVRDFIDYKKKVNKIYYQHNTDLINRLRNGFDK